MLVGADPLLGSDYVQFDNNGDTLWTRRFNMAAQVALNNSWPLLHASGKTSFLQQYTDSVRIWTTAGRLEFESGRSFGVNTSKFIPSNSSWNIFKALPSGNIVLAGGTTVVTGGGTSEDRMVTVNLLDSACNLLWSRQYHIEGVMYTPSLVTEREDRIFVLGESYTFGPPNSTRSSGVLVLKKSDGTLLYNTMEAMRLDGDLEFTAVSSEGNYVVGWNFSVSDPPVYGVLAKLSDSGSPPFDWVRRIQVNDYPYTELHTVEYDTISNRIYVGGGAGELDDSLGGWSDTRYFLGASDSAAGPLLWAAVYADTNANGELQQNGVALLSRITDNNVLSCGEFTGSLGPGYIVNADKQTGHSGCMHNPVNASWVNTNPVVVYYNITADSNILYNPRPFSLAADIETPAIVGQPLLICQDNNMGIENATADVSWSIYPNPVGDGFYLSSEDQINSTVSVTIVNMEGRQVYANSEYFPGTWIVASGWSAGIYLVVCRDGDAFIRKKMIHL